jgi:hypothetical protein
MSALTAALAVRISPEADRLRWELQTALKQPANKIVERALRALARECSAGPEPSTASTPRSTSSPPGGVR